MCEPFGNASKEGRRPKAPPVAIHTKVAPTKGDGKYASYRYIGGDLSKSLCPTERAKAITYQTNNEISKACVAKWQSVTLGAVQFLLTRLSRRTRVRAIVVNPLAFREELRRQFLNKHPEETTRRGLLHTINMAQGEVELL